jgi:hypothetical protein
MSAQAKSQKMNVSLNENTLLFAPFPASFKAASWSTIASMFLRSSFKTCEKNHQKSKFSH